VYHGNGNVDAVASVSVNGEITQNARLSGTYTVNADCTSSLTYPDLNVHYDLFIAPDSSMFTFLHSDPGLGCRGSNCRERLSELATESRSPR